MKRLIVALSTAALLLSAYAVYKAKKSEAAAKPQLQLIATLFT